MHLPVGRQNIERQSAAGNRRDPLPRRFPACHPTEKFTADITTDKPAAQSNLIFYAAAARADLKKLRALKKSIKPAVAVWVIYPKRVKIITAADVFAAGLVDVKVARFSDRQTALKFVIPVAERT